MDIKRLKDKGLQLWKKYRYAILVLALGVVLMLIPGKSDPVKDAPTPVQSEIQPNMEQRLETILSQISGAGKVSVMITVSAGEEILYQQDVDTDSQGNRSDTVIVTDSQRNQQGLIQQVLPETYQGVIVVCQGANHASIRLSIIEAVSKVTGLGTDKIIVLKMK